MFSRRKWKHIFFQGWLSKWKYEHELVWEEPLQRYGVPFSTKTREFVWKAKIAYFVLTLMCTNSSLHLMSLSIHIAARVWRNNENPHIDNEEKLFPGVSKGKWVSVSFVEFEIIAQPIIIIYVHCIHLDESLFITVQQRALKKS